MEVRVGVNSDEVAVVDDGVVGAVHPGSPGVDVTNGGLSESGAGDGGADLADIAGDGGWVGAHSSLGFNAHDGVAVEILTADGDTDDEFGESRAKVMDSGGQASQLALEAGISP